jgi:hypothetical protein
MTLTMPDLPLIEPVPIDDDLCTGLAMVEDADVGARFVFYARQTSYEAKRAQVLVVRRKIVLPIEAIMPALELAVRFTAQIGEHRWRALCRLMK